jgi:hypothetical protein
VSSRGAERPRDPVNELVAQQHIINLELLRNKLTNWIHTESQRRKCSAGTPLDDG